MDTQRTPDELGIENEAICEKLLDWKRSSIVGYWFPSQERVGTVRTPSFITWADAGLILNALAFRGFSFDLSHTQTEDGLMQFGLIVWFPGKRYTVDTDMPQLAIRAAALEYIRSLP